MKSSLIPLSIGLLAATFFPTVSAHAQSTRRVSVATDGTQANGHSYAPSISADGRWVAFESVATNLVAGDSNQSSDVFLHDGATATTTQVSVSSLGAGGDAASVEAAASADGTRIAFTSYSTNLVTGDANGMRDVFLRNRVAGTTERVSVATSGAEANGQSFLPSISADGRYVAFASGASNLVTGDTNSVRDVFVRDRVSGTTVRASVGTMGVEGNAHSGAPSISGDGRFMAFQSDASNLVPGDTNSVRDVFVRDLVNATTTRVSLGVTGGQGDGHSEAPWICADGRFVAFHSFSTWQAFGYGVGLPEVYVRDLQASTTVCVSLTPGGYESYYGSTDAVLDADGSHVAVVSRSFDLVAADNNGAFDVFVRLLPAGSMTRASVADSGSEANNSSGSAALSADGRFVAFESTATNLVLGDSNGRSDIFVRDRWWYCYPDVDMDGFGDASGFTAQPVACSAGYVNNGLDCDDTNAVVHPAAVEVCNGADDDCDGAIDDGYLAAYCTAGTSVHGCVASISGTGLPSSVAASGFDVRVTNIDGQRYGTIFYGFYPSSTPWAPSSTSFKCVANPVQRLGVQDSGGTAGQCDGELSLDFNAWMQANPGGLGSPFVAGQAFYAQGWFRDPGAPKGTNLSDGLRFTLCQ